MCWKCDGLNTVQILSEKLDASEKVKRIRELYDDLERLCSYEGVRNAILVFHALEIVQKRIHGKQTLRAYPFPDNTFHGTNRRDITMKILA